MFKTFEKLTAFELMKLGVSTLTKLDKDSANFLPFRARINTSELHR